LTALVSGTEISIAKSKNHSVDAEGKETMPMAQVDTVVAATAFDAEGNVVGVKIDNAQTRVNYDAEGQVTQTSQHQSFQK
jgi:YD repeat-containing protein